MITPKHTLKVSKKLYLEQWDSYYKVETLLGNTKDKLYFIETTIYEVREDNYIVNEWKTFSGNQQETFTLDELGIRFKNLCGDMTLEIINNGNYSPDYEFDDFNELSDEEIEQYRAELKLDPELDVKVGHLSVMVNAHNIDELDTKTFYQFSLEYIECAGKYYITNDVLEIYGRDETEDDDAETEVVKTLGIYQLINVGADKLKAFSKQELISLGKDLMESFTEGLFQPFFDEK